MLSKQAVKERPIIFSGPMVRAILEGRKTQTRRVVRPQPRPGLHLQRMWGTSPPPDPVDFGEPGLWRQVGPDYPDGDEDDVRCPYGAPGDRLWVRECFCILDRDGWQDMTQPRDALLGYDTPRRNACAHRAECGAESERCRIELGYHWSPSIHMPRWASRLTLEIVSVRVERLQEITHEDARAEGAAYMPSAGLRDEPLPVSVIVFAGGWDTINGKRAPWASNPWVWVIEFRRAA